MWYVPHFKSKSRVYFLFKINDVQYGARVFVLAKSVFTSTLSAVVPPMLMIGSKGVASHSHVNNAGACQPLILYYDS